MTKTPALGLAICAAWLVAAAPAGQEAPANRLAREASPYLQLHARNPVDWYPWSEEAFARARAEDKPIFLSIGYSTCYWCHVMEREVFSDPEIAAQLNAHFVSIKVDREERPDVDHVYLLATELLTGAGGWPNSLFLTPDGEPFYAGTYFPPEDRRGKPGFPRVLAFLSQSWSENRQPLIDTAARVRLHLRESLEPDGAATGPPADVDALFENALAELAGDFDPEHGGFGGAPKFPRAPLLELLLTRLERTSDERAATLLAASLEAMARGGLYDQLGGGFHRYATDAAWSLPHFEKMLYDNALLASVYARAFARNPDPGYRRVVRETLAYLERELSLPRGGFASAQDAESGESEGAFYLWTRAELESRLGRKRAAEFLEVYELVPHPESEAGGVLRVSRARGESVEARIARLRSHRDELRAARAQRPRPRRDDKALTAWNALAIRAWVDAAKALDDPAYLGRAERTADFVLEQLRSESGGLHRSYIAGQRRERGVLEDYAYLTEALLALGEATAEPRWTEAARGVAEAMLARFEDPTGGGFFFSELGSQLLVRPKSFDDAALPSANAVAARALGRLAAGTGEPRYAKAARRAARAAGARLAQAPRAHASWLTALADIDRDPAIAGPERPPQSRDHVRVSARSASDGHGLRVLLEIDAGWHVNANPASSRFLIPTEISLPGAESPAEIRYPEGHRFRPAFADEAIQVYEGRVEIPVLFSSEAGTESARPTAVDVRYQACDQTRCLAPERERIALEQEPAS